ncbi:MAG: M28 family peptidase [Hyphomicrobium sp.]
MPLFAAVAMLAIVASAVWYSIVFPRQPFKGPLPALEHEDVRLAHSLQEHVTAVASQPHNIEYYDALEAAAHYIERSLIQFGLKPQAQIFAVADKSVRNIEVVWEPVDATPVTPSIIIGAHYDSPGDAPGANDNGTGVAAALELAHRLANFTPATHRLRLAFWVNEERPYGKTPDMGSWQHAKALKDSRENIEGMIALETIGYFSNEPNSQDFPVPFGLIYPKKGNFIAFVGLPGSRSFLHRALGHFRSHTQFPSIGGVAPGFLEGIDLSDHWAFHHFGFPAMMVTDTAPFRNPYYHELDDLPENVDYESLARVTRGLEKMLRKLLA